MLLNAVIMSVCVKERAVSIAWVAVSSVLTPAVLPVASCSTNPCRPVSDSKHIFLSNFVHVLFLQAVVVEAENFFLFFSLAIICNLFYCS